MLPTIGFDAKFILWAVEIHFISPNRKLPPEFYSIQLAIS